MKKAAFKYTQADQLFYSTVFTYSEVKNNSIVSIYSRDNRLGYQRALNERHLKKIVVSLKKDKTPISPTSILLGIDEEKIEEIEESNGLTSVKFIGNSDGSIFRIIDGQHRITSIERYIEELKRKDSQHEIEELEGYEFSVIIMPIKNDYRRREVEVFQSINAKAKTLKTDLTKLALIRYEELEKVNDIDYSDHLAHRVIFSLNDNAVYDETNNCSATRINVWENAIKIDVNNDDEIGIISYNAFYNSIIKICEIVIEKRNPDILNQMNFEDLDNYLNKRSNELTLGLLIPTWEIIKGKWEKCFELNNITLDKSVYYDENYYIQKNMGLRSIHLILLDLINKDGDLNFLSILEEFRLVIEQSTLDYFDWEKGGKFKGLSSEAGFKHIKSIIIGE